MGCPELWPRKATPRYEDVTALAIDYHRMVWMGACSMYITKVTSLFEIIGVTLILTAVGFFAGIVIYTCYRILWGKEHEDI